MASIRLTPMQQADFEAYIEAETLRYAQENVRAGFWTAEEAVERSKVAHRNLLPDGLRTPHHHLTRIEEERTAEVVGALWWVEDRSGAQPTAFVYDLYVREGWRGQGFAAAAMRALEDEARRRGLHSVQLHVFAHNRTAIRLYERLGYSEKSQNMMKVLGHPEQR